MEKKGLAIRIALFHLLTIKNDPAATIYPCMALPAIGLFLSQRPMRLEDLFFIKSKDAKKPAFTWVLSHNHGISIAKVFFRYSSRNPKLTT
jgi:hypothetical protein